MAATWCSEVSPSVSGPASATGGGGSLGYIRLATFNSKTVEAFREALASLKVGAGPLRSRAVGGRGCVGGAERVS